MAKGRKHRGRPHTTPAAVKPPELRSGRLGHGQPCGLCDGSCRLRPRGGLNIDPSPILPSLTPSTGSSTFASQTPGGSKIPVSCVETDDTSPVRAPATLPDGDDHPEYGSVVASRDLRAYLTHGPGAFCSPPWRCDLKRLMKDVNIMFRCIATSSVNVSSDSRALRRALLDFYIMGYTNQRPTRACWETLLQLSSEQARPLRATLRHLNTTEPCDRRFLEPPTQVPPILFGQECDVSGSEDSEDGEGVDIESSDSDCGETSLSEFSYVGGDGDETSTSDSDSGTDDDSDETEDRSSSSSESDSSDVDYGTRVCGKKRRCNPVRRSARHAAKRKRM
ncbi:regulatory protein ICP22 [Felid alphaherpesvirus 1]|uniref:Transcriptional regulator ICP22 homolog n=1 Tax=Feline herpesvirus 1 TaxID=10334 RepID=Q69362_FHV1|nr:regulatory protein ICP22 [Felid alphaherpesvirus 1]YP_003331595.1 regulatory protein ICP22 [Felid alphaherpesvirus 1]AMN88995.1 regulatory protein ICP22 [synthetic construct]ACT88358.1 regulatory protein ICP22 [Felid alphaherpesvirus 1]ACT88364.1 regulatory protein ICP22 [Felid alphaherpesvirus 1]ALJ84100.1 regulatory protein ICP22 [Felid alphaherpesvirus 1]ALJ84101.1 regulatory protein ICP22 [Felid alphaherpesvirus 1]